ncbi:ATP-binding protein [Rheinheimera marina]|uniref:histidine kinase n=1 Tax=Rheinheimera marina TaxID=1774958 RepID=A0ABV9JIU9_9GAMM
MPRVRRPIPLLLALYLLMLVLCAMLTQSWLLHSVEQKASEQRAMIAAFIRYEIGRYASLPQELTGSVLLQQLARTPGAELNDYLKQLQRSANIADLYLVDSSGLVFASSNTDQPHSYLGKDFGFRPYVQRALLGQTGYYYALGHTSGRRGVYYSAPLLNNKAVSAVLVAKLDLEPIENHQQEVAGLSNHHFMVTGPSQDIFLSDVEAWRLTRLTDASPSIQEQQRYLTGQLAPVGLEQRRSWLQPWQQYWVLPYRGKPQSFITVQQELPEFGWVLTVLTPAHSTVPNLLWALLAFSLLYLSAVLLFGLRRERRKRHQQLLAHNQQLEQRVIARTKDLADSNRQLIRQIERREQTESELAQTQQELIQAERLATIGALSASLNHELNQPLTALNSYAQTTEKMLDKSMWQDARQNLKAMQQLVQRLSAIVAQFKDFSRKSASKSEPLPVNKLVMDALGIVHPQCQQAQVRLRLQLPEQSPVVLADAIQLEQVLVNILTNGIQAMAASADKELTVTVRQQPDAVQILIRDQGPGIEPHHLEKVFEAFFSTKQRDGLGLGLAISRRIVHSLHGTLQVCNHPKGGAEFVISLPVQPTGLTL